MQSVYTGITHAIQMGTRNISVPLTYFVENYKKYLSGHSFI